MEEEYFLRPHFWSPETKECSFYHWNYTWALLAMSMNHFVFWNKLKFFTKAVTIFRDFPKHHTENTENCYILIDPKLKQNLYTTNFKSSFVKPLCNVLKHFMKAEGVLWTFSEALQNCLKRLILIDSLFGNIQNGLIFTWLILFLILWSNVLNS